MSDTVLAELERITRETLQVTGELPRGELSESFDSMQLMELVVAVEDHFRIALDPDDEAEARTLDDVVALIERKRGGTGE